MAMYLTHEEHDANPPTTWTVSKIGGKWSLCDKNGTVMTTTNTKKEAEALKTQGFLYDIYQKEGKWFRGEPVANWKPYKPKS